jgi:hypothetical protein
MKADTRTRLSAFLFPAGDTVPAVKADRQFFSIGLSACPPFDGAPAPVDLLDGETEPPR